MISSQNKHNILISEQAAIKIGTLISNGEDKGKKLRISVNGGGCSGFQYKYEFVEKISADDLIITNGNAIVIVDEISAEYMKDSIIDHVETLGASHFQIKNPNASSKCGCGNSFNI